MAEVSRSSDQLSDIEFAQQIAAFEVGEDPIQATLRTDDRVLARVTDGIYRQPSSALRELISNAYDADATRVVIKMDRPRFQRIIVDDDGLGMSPDVLAYLLRHIGGSAKRSSIGAGLGVTSRSDPLRSPGGRRLIGKIGIGMFSVAQLTQAFQIVTKTAGDDRRTVATVVMRQYADDAILKPGGGNGRIDDLDSDVEYEAGLVTIWREPAADPASHGTTIVLTDIRVQTQSTLRSDDVWAAIEQSDTAAISEQRRLPRPAFHVGRVLPTDSDLLRADGNSLDQLPWSETDAPIDAFVKLVHAVFSRAERSAANTRLNQTLDYYLQMVWNLSLAAPLPYVDGHPFDIAFDRSVRLFTLPDNPRGATQEVDLRPGESVRSRLSLGDAAPADSGFAVVVDDLRLLRPLRFRNLPTTSHALKEPLLFVGECEETFANQPPQFSGGILSFDAYILWTPRVIPADHQGVLVRIHGSSGTLFDPSFFRYQTAEITRTHQLTAEIFVKEGLDSALNIDRESFNYSHPHVVFLTKWLHNALTKVATTQKRIAAEVRSEARRAQSEEATRGLEEIVRDVWQDATGDEDLVPPPVTFSDVPPDDAQAGYRFPRVSTLGRSEAGRTGAERLVEKQLAAIAQVLAAFDVFDELTAVEQERLLQAIRQVLEIST